MRAALLAALAVTVLAPPVRAQELEPRALINAPVGVNFVLLAAGYARGNVLLEPTLPLEDVQADLGTLTAGYVRSINVLGMASKVTVAVPTATGRWEGTLSGQDTATSRTGFGDAVLKLAVNFVGSPALGVREFRTYRQSTVMGASFAVTAPVGQYDPRRLINLGTNRWSFSPRLGASHIAGRWVFEAYGAVTFFTTNPDFLGGNRLSQRPFADVQGHVIYGIRGADLWAAASLGYGWGGGTAVNGQRNASISNARASAVLRVPVARGHALKLAYVTGLRTNLGADFDTIQLAYQYAWGGRP